MFTKERLTTALKFTLQFLIWLGVYVILFFFLFFLGGYFEILPTHGISIALSIIAFAFLYYLITDFIISKIPFLNVSVESQRKTSKTSGKMYSETQVTELLRKIDNTNKSQHIISFVLGILSSLVAEYILKLVQQ